MPAPDPSSVRFAGPWRHRDIHANAIRIHVAEALPANGEVASDAPLVVMLHGFGEFWWSWRHQLAALVEQGFRAVAVDLRGYGDTDKPPRGYDGWTLSSDVAALIRALGYAKAHLVGHADGGLVCWATANLHPRLVDKIVVISSPHPVSVRRAAVREFRQRNALLKTLVPFQLPWTPERRLTRDDGAAAEQFLRERSGAAWPVSAEFAEVAAKVRSAVQIPGAAHCSLEYQRWAFRSQFRPDGHRFFAAMERPLDIPVLQLHGAADPFVLTSTLRHDRKWAPQMEQRVIKSIGHFVHEEAPEATNAELVRFLAN